MGTPDRLDPVTSPLKAQEAVMLTGGRITAGVFRVGETVRRPATPSSGFVADLLTLLERRGFDGAPRFLGREGATDVLSYLAGEVPARFRTWSDEQVAAAGSPGKDVAEDQLAHLAWSLRCEGGRQKEVEAEVRIGAAGGEVLVFGRVEGDNVERGEGEGGTVGDRSSFTAPRAEGISPMLPLTYTRMTVTLPAIRVTLCWRSWTDWVTSVASHTA